MLFRPPTIFFSVRFNVGQRSFQTHDFTLLSMAGRIQGLLLHNNSSLVSGGDVYSSVFAKWNGNKAGKD